ncbi:MAG: zinc-dependent metalloprotease family protein [Gammaproteobacteria bacterium]
MKKLVSRFIAILVLTNVGPALAQSGLWQEVTPRAKLSTDISTTRYFDSDDQALRDLLNLVPNELSGQSATIYLPMPDGSLARFSIVESSIMETGLAAKYPQIKSYKVYGIDDPGASGRVDISPKGLRGMLYTSLGRVFIDPDWQNPVTQRYRSRTSRGEPSTSGFQCSANQLAGNQSYSPDISFRIENRIAGSLLQYRLAVSTTQEYALAPSVNTSGPIDDPTIISDALAEINTAINRVNVIYERDLGIRLVLIGNNNLLIDTTGTSPLAGFNSDGLELLANNKSWIDTRIGVSSYDIGHVFSTGGGGVARLGSVCDASLKAQGVTGLPNPVGDVFYIDFVAHEIGHQFGAEHTFNGTTSNCFGINRIALNAFEPGSGSTVMAYAGICGAENIQPHSDATFHSKSIEQIDSFVSSVAGSCNLTTASASNLNEPIANAGVDRVIPISTPFLLQGNGTDADAGDTLSYQWDQIDAGTETSSATLGDDLGDNALFRTYVPQPGGDRDFPALGTQVVDGPFDLSEALPCTARDLNFRLTVRDGKSGRDTDDLKLTVDSSSGPFKITSQTTATTIFVNSGGIPITWDVANTDNAPVNCANVDIDLLTFSSDYSTYAVTSLLTNVANNGNQSVSLLLKDNSASKARFRVSCRDNIFYDISDVDLVIQNTGGGGAGNFATTGNTTFFNDLGLVSAASAGACNAGAGPVGGGGNFANIGTGSSIFDYLWLIFLSSLLFRVSLKRLYSSRFRFSASLRRE